MATTDGVTTQESTPPVERLGAAIQKAAQRLDPYPASRTIPEAAEAYLRADPALAEDLALGAAFREAVGALRSGRYLILTGPDEGSHMMTDAFNEAHRWSASTTYSSAAAYGSTPTAALQALTEKLRTTR